MPRSNPRPRVTGSRNRSTRSSSRPVTQGQNPQRSNRQSTSTARVTQGGQRAGGRSPGGVRVTNSSQRTTTSSARVTGTSRPALPPGRQGGAIVRQETKPENPRRTSARSRQTTSARGTTGPNRVGQPAGSANRQFGANVVNRSVNRAITQTRLANVGRVAGRVALPVAIAAQIKDIQEGFKKLANHPFVTGRKNYTQGTTKAGPPAPKAKPPKAPSLPTSSSLSSSRSNRTSGGTSTSSSTRSSGGTTRSNRSSAPASTSRTSSASSRSSSSTSSTPRVTNTTTSNIGPVKSGEEYGKLLGKRKSLASQRDEIKKMIEESKKRQGK